MRHLLLGLVLLSWPSVASAQVSWAGAYAGVAVGVGFKTQQFGVTDGWFAGATFHGAVDPRVNVVGHGGFDFQARRLVVGGEFGVGQLGYSGELSYGPKDDTKATTKGSLEWLAMGRVGWVYRQAMPYFGAGVIGSQNAASIVDDCNSGGCGSQLGQGSGTTSSTRWALAYGVQFASTKRIAGRGWAVRVEWLQVDSKPVDNVFQRTVTGPPIPGSGGPIDTTVANTISTPLSSTLRILFDIRLTKK
jgi:hypothetical protein